MLLRRFTKHVTDQNWFAVFIDFLIVVTGVFIGIQVANWNEVSQDRESEVVALDRLIAEYEKNRKLLAVDVEKSGLVLQATEKLLALIAPEPDQSITDESFAQTFLDCMNNPGLIPNQGVTNSLMSSGNLNLIGDAEIQSSLSQWQADFQNISKWQNIEREHGEELILGLTMEYVSLTNLSLHFNTHSSDKKSKLSSDYQGLFSSRRFEGLLVNRRYNVLSSIKRLEELDVDTVRLIELMQARKKEIL